MRSVKGIARFLLVTVGIVIVTSLGIDATQYFEGSGSALSILTQEALEGECPVNMVEVVGGLCVDRYEVSAGAECPHQDPGSVAETSANLNTVACQPQSAPQQNPWRNISYHQAVAACALANKRLPENNEWYQAALATPDNGTSCATTGGMRPAGEMSTCVSGVGAFDMVGNVWEWVMGEVENGQYNGGILPTEGYVADVYADGVASLTATTSQVIFNQDYFWSNPIGSYHMMRGGFFGSGDDAGVYAVHADIDSTFAGAAIGFRCVTDI